MAKSKHKPKPPSSNGALGLDAFAEPAEQSGLSLDQLGAAFAEMLSTGDDPYGDKAKIDDASTQPEDIADSRAALAEIVEATPDDDTCEISPRTIFEAMLFVGSPANEPLTSQQVASLMRGVRPAEID